MMEEMILLCMLLVLFLIIFKPPNGHAKCFAANLHLQCGCVFCIVILTVCNLRPYSFFVFLFINQVFPNAPKRKLGSPVTPNC